MVDFSRPGAAQATKSSPVKRKTKSSWDTINISRTFVIIQMLCGSPDLKLSAEIVQLFLWTVLKANNSLSFKGNSDSEPSLTNTEI